MLGPVSCWPNYGWGPAPATSPAPTAKEGAATSPALQQNQYTPLARALKVKFDGLAGFQHLDTPVRTQDLTGHPGHQTGFTTSDVSRETLDPDADLFPCAL